MTRNIKAAFHQRKHGQIGFLVFSSVCAPVGLLCAFYANP